MLLYPLVIQGRFSFEGTPCPSKNMSPMYRWPTNERKTQHVKVSFLHELPEQLLQFSLNSTVHEGTSFFQKISFGVLMMAVESTV